MRNKNESTQVVKGADSLNHIHELAYKKNNKKNLKNIYMHMCASARLDP